MSGTNYKRCDKCELIFDEDVIGSHCYAICEERAQHNKDVVNLVRDIARDKRRALIGAAVRECLKVEQDEQPSLYNVWWVTNRIAGPHDTKPEADAEVEREVQRVIAALEGKQ